MFAININCEHVFMFSSGEGRPKTSFNEEFQMTFQDGLSQKVKHIFTASVLRHLLMR